MTRFSNSATIIISSGSTALASAAAGMSVGQWLQFTQGSAGYLSTFTETPGPPTSPASGHVLGYIDKGCWDAQGKRVLYVTGDHFSGTNGQSRFVNYSDATGTYSRLTAGSWFPFVSSSARHGYHHNAVDNVGKKLYHKLFSVREVYRLDLTQPITSGAWTLLPAPPTGYNASAVGCDFVPWVGSQGSFMMHQTDSGTTGSLYRYDVASNAWSIPVNTTIPNCGDIHNILEASPSINYAIMGGGNGNSAPGTAVHVLNPAGTLLVNRTTAPQQFAIQQSIVTHCPASGDFLFIYGATNWWKYNAVTNVWTQMAGTAGVFTGGTQDNQPIAIAATPITDYGVIKFDKMIGANNGSVWLYKHA